MALELCTRENALTKCNLVAAAGFRLAPRCGLRRRAVMQRSPLAPVTAATI
jgi:hypothetical protein